MSPETTGTVAEHNVVSLMGIVLIALIAVTAALAYAWTTATRHPRRAPAPPAPAPARLTPSRLTASLRATAALLAAGAAALYAHGAVRLLGLDITEHDQACRAAVGAARVPRLDGYEATYVPLRLGCRVAGDGTYTAGVPAWLNPSAAGLALTAAACAAAAALTTPGPRRACTRRARSRVRAPGRTRP
ncbi:hypothetical protein GCM10018785_71040 [Streptomyces longispororuber]|uniref:Uncharacterized protein n=1 Tax=Streptomyces longispororuber TaxID=68230 RepID=A0A919DZ28_9ACTN|nr:hypothetical protein [Streptomyces longispororuber]GHE95694.1 hypothetical protein GCM10018785_71040 [Streptomyces longispororuber]